MVISKRIVLLNLSLLENHCALFRKWKAAILEIGPLNVSLQMAVVKSGFFIFLKHLIDHPTSIASGPFYLLLRNDMRHVNFINVK